MGFCLVRSVYSPFTNVAKTLDVVRELVCYSVPLLESLRATKQPVEQVYGERGMELVRYKIETTREPEYIALLLYVVCLCFYVFILRSISSLKKLLLIIYFSVSSVIVSQRGILQYERTCIHLVTSYWSIEQNNDRGTRAIGMNIQ